MKKVNFVMLIVFVLSLSSFALALSEPIIFPKEGQSKEQQAQDKMSCDAWAKDETGVDPSYVKAKLETAIEQSGSGSGPKAGRTIFKAAAVGAGMGAIDKNIDNKVGSSATKGVLAGAVIANKNRKDAAQEQQAQQQASQIDGLQAQYDKYIRAFSVCMDAKGYSVK